MTYRGKGYSGKKYRHNGQNLTVKEWAEKTGLNASLFRKRIEKFGIAEAVDMGSAIRGYSRVATPHRAEVPSKFDQDLELKNRIKHYRKKGWSDQEILSKFKMFGV